MQSQFVLSQIPKFAEMLVEIPSITKVWFSLIIFVCEIPKFWWHPMKKIIEKSAFSSSLIKESSHCKRCSCSSSSALMCPAGGSFAWWFFSTEMGIKPTSSVTSTKKHFKKIWQEHPRGYVVIFVDMIFILEKMEVHHTHSSICKVDKVVKVVLYPSCRVNTLSWQCRD